MSNWLSIPYPGLPIKIPLLAQYASIWVSSKNILSPSVIILYLPCLDFCNQSSNSFLFFLSFSASIFADIKRLSDSIISFSYLLSNSELF